MQGGAGYVTVGKDKVIVAHEAGGAFVALSALCRHEGCTVTFRPDQEDLRRPCHGALSALDGAVTKGSPSKALKVYAATLAGDVVVVHLP